MSGSDAFVARFSMGQVISRTFGVLGRNLVTIGAIALLIAVVIFALEFAFGAGLAAMYPQINRAYITAPGGIIAVILQCIVFGAVTRVAVADLDRTRIGIGDALGTGIGLLFPLLGLGIVTALGVGLASLLLVVPGIILALRWIVATPVRVAEGPSIGRALSRSATLTKGHRWSLFGLMLAFVILSLIVNVAFTGLAVAVTGGMAGATKLIVTGALKLLGSAITSSISSTGVAVCYVELRRTVEGADFRELASVFA